VGYYADSVEGSGHWLGRGMAGVNLTGQVDAADLLRVLQGEHPASATQLVGAVATLDGRALYAHAKTAGALAAAQLHTELTHTHGLAWQPVARGWPTWPAFLALQSWP